MIKASNLYKNFGDLNVLNDINISINQSEIVSIVGKSGAGKTTLLQILGTLEKPSSGEVFYENSNVLNLGKNAISEFRNKNIGFIFQFHHLLPEFTAIENICMPGYIAKKNKKELTEKAMHFLKILDLENRKDHKPNELSGGEQQRISVARALINDPKIILADEPTGSLDMKTAKDIFKLLNNQKRSDRLIIYATHNRFFANKADCLLEMRDGSIKSSNV